MKTPPWFDEPEPAYIPPIRILFAERLVGRLQEAGEALDRVSRPGPEFAAAARDAAESLFRIAHDLAGTSESFGGVRLGLAAAQVADLLREHGDEPVSPSPDVLARLLPLFAEMTAAGEEFLRWMEMAAPHPQKLTPKKSDTKELSKDSPTG